MASEEQRRRWSMLDAERPRALDEPVHRRAVEVAAAAETVRARQPREQLEIDLLREPAEGAVGHVPGFAKRAWLQVMRNQPDDLRPYVEAIDRVDVQPI